MSLSLVKKHMQEFEALKISNSVFFMMTFDVLSKPSTLNEVNIRIAREIGLTFTPGQQQSVAKQLEKLGLLESEVKEKRGRITVHNYFLSVEGKKLVEALKKFLYELE